MDEYDSTETWKDQIGATGEFAIVQAITIPCGMKEVANKHFGLRVLAFYSCHIPASFFFGFYISHNVK